MDIEYNPKLVTLVIGNGFDISLGLKTKYSDFIRYVNCELNEDENYFDETKQIYVHEKLKQNKLYNYLNAKNGATWIDIEHELEKNALSHIKESNAPIFYTTEAKAKVDNYPIIDKENYLEIRKYLKSYLKEIDSKFDAFDIDTYCPANILMTDILRRKLQLQVINFNYTRTFAKIFNFYRQQPNFNFNFSYKEYFKLHHVHGSVDKDIVFGIDDKTEIRKDYVYLLKSFDRNTSNINFNTILNHSGKIIFFGYSLGLSDASYFEDFFISLCEHNNTEEHLKRELIFYYKGEDDYTNLFYRLKELTGHKTAKLLRYNNVQFIDVDNYHSCFRADELMS